MIGPVSGQPRSERRFSPTLHSVLLRSPRDRRRTIMDFPGGRNRRGRRADAGERRASGQGRGPYQGADAGGSGTAGRGVRAPVLRVGRRGGPGGSFAYRRIRGRTLPLELRRAARAWGVEDPGLQPPFRGTRLAIDPYSRRDG